MMTMVIKKTMRKMTSLLRLPLDLSPLFRTPLHPPPPPPLLPPLQVTPLPLVRLPPSLFLSLDFPVLLYYLSPLDQQSLVPPAQAHNYRQRGRNEIQGYNKGVSEIV